MGFASHCQPPRGPAGQHTAFLVVLPGGCRELLLGFLVCRFSGESLAYASDDGVVVGIIFLVEGITMIEDLNLQD